MDIGFFLGIFLPEDFSEDFLEALHLDIYKAVLKLE